MQIPYFDVEMIKQLKKKKQGITIEDYIKLSREER